MVDNTNQVDSGGNTLYLNNLVLGVPVAVASSGVAGGLSTGSYARQDGVRLVLTGVNFNSASTDNPIAVYLPGGSTTERYSVSAVYLNKASASISTATVGVFTGAGATGSTIAANQAITVTGTAGAAANNTQSLTLTNATTVAYAAPTIYIRVGTAQGSAATADVIVVLNLLS